MFLLDLAVQTPGALATLIWGPPGASKTSQVRQMCKHLGIYQETIIASCRAPEDFGGINMPGDDGLVLDPPAWAKRLQRVAAAAKTRNGEMVALAFMDEVSCTPPATQAPLLRVVHERVIGELELPPSVRFVAAANPPDQAAGGWDLAPALATRFIHLQWPTPTVAQWTDWLMQGDSVTTFSVLDHVEWKKCWHKARALVAAFLRKMPECLMEDIDKVVRFPPASANPRTWECATRLLASAMATGREDAKLPLMTACIGPPIAQQFMVWLANADLPEPEDVLANPGGWVPDASRPDMAFAVLSAVTNAVVSERDRKDYGKRWIAAWQVIARTLDLGKDIGIVCARTLGTEKNRPKRALTDKTVLPVIKEFSDVIREAGLFDGGQG